MVTVVNFFLWVLPNDLCFLLNSNFLFPTNWQSLQKLRHPSKPHRQHKAIHLTTTNGLNLSYSFSSKQPLCSPLGQHLDGKWSPTTSTNTDRMKATERTANKLFSKWKTWRNQVSVLLFFFLKIIVTHKMPFLYYHTSPFTDQILEFVLISFYNFNMKGF